MQKMTYAFLPAAAFALLFTFASPAGAQTYPWCAVYGGKAGGSSNCGFSTLEQCRATVSGMGGFCARNSFYTGPEGRPIRRVHKRKQSQG
jgi:hypothetical protein